jgi:1-deoxy-D-xylulose-5-phosphate synthase
MSVGAMAATALHVADLLAAQGIGATVIDPRWVVPVPQSVVEMSAEHRLVVTIEDGIKVGGIGTRVRQDLRDAQIDTALTEIGLPDEFIDHATRNEILEDSGLTAQAIARNIVAQVVGSRIPHARSVEASSATSDATKPSTIS